MALFQLRSDISDSTITPSQGCPICLCYVSDRDITDGGSQYDATITLTQEPLEGDVLHLNTQVITFVTTITRSNQVQLGGSAINTGINLFNYLSSLAMFEERYYSLGTSIAGSQYSIIITAVNNGTKWNQSFNEQGTTGAVLSETKGTDLTFNPGYYALIQVWDGLNIVDSIRVVPKAVSSTLCGFSNTEMCVNIEPSTRKIAYTIPPNSNTVNPTLVPNVFKTISIRELEYIDNVQIWESEPLNPTTVDGKLINALCKKYDKTTLYNNTNQPVEFLTLGRGINTLRVCVNELGEIISTFPLYFYAPDLTGSFIFVRIENNLFITSINQEGVYYMNIQGVSVGFDKPNYFEVYLEVFGGSNLTERLEIGIDRGVNCCCQDGLLILNCKGVFENVLTSCERSSGISSTFTEFLGCSDCISSQNMSSNELVEQRGVLSKDYQVLKTIYTKPLKNTDYNIEYIRRVITSTEMYVLKNNDITNKKLIYLQASSNVVKTNDNRIQVRLDYVEATHYNSLKNR